MTTDERVRQRALLEATLAALIAAVMSLAVFGPVMKWLAVGWSGGDMLSTYINVEVWQGFRYSVTDQFGFPLGMNLNYFPGIDITENTFAQLVSSVTGRPFVGINLLILVTFPLVAFLTYFLFRMTGLSGPLAVAGAVTFSLIPFHFGRALGHTYLATLYSAVTGIALVLLIGSGKWQKIVALMRGTTTQRGTKLGLAAVIAGLIGVTAWTGVYYAGFTLLLGAAALLWRLSHGATWRGLIVDSLPLIGVALLAMIGFLPSALTTLSDPPIGTLGDRSAYDSVVFAGFLAVLLLPIPASPLPGFDSYNRFVSESIAAGGWVESSAQSNYGTWITLVALLTLVGGLIARTRRRLDIRTETSNRASPTFITYLLLVSLLFFMPWGLNYLLANTVTAQIRAWNRLTPIMLLLILLGAAAVICNTRLVKSQALTVSTTVLVLALTFTDSVLPFRNAYADVVSEGASITKAGRDYATATNSVIPENCGVLQLPTVGYPEAGKIGGLNDYDHFWPSITNPGKRWSYGAVKATDAFIWAGQMPEVPTDEQVALMRGAGFCAIHLDVRAWRDEEVPSIVRELSARFGAPRAAGNDDTWQLFDIRQVAPESGIRSEAFFHQPMIAIDPSTTNPRESRGQELWWWTKDQKADFSLIPAREHAPVEFVRGWLSAPVCGPRPVTVTLRTETESVEETIISRPDRRTPFEVRLPVPSTSPATLEVLSPGVACSAADFPGNRFVQVGNLQPY